MSIYGQACNQIVMTRHHCKVSVIPGESFMTSQALGNFDSSQQHVQDEALFEAGIEKDTTRRGLVYVANGQVSQLLD